MANGIGYESALNRKTDIESLSLCNWWRCTMVVVEVTTGGGRVVAVVVTRGGRSVVVVLIRSGDGGGIVVKMVSN